MERAPGMPTKSHAGSGSWSSCHEAKKLSISILVISLPLLYVSLLHVPPSSLMKDTTFWFLMSNSIIIIVAADSGVFSSSRGAADDLYDELLRHSRARTAAACTTVVPPMLTNHVGDHLLGDQQKTRSVEQELNNAQNQSSPVVVDKSVVVHEKPSKQKVAMIKSAGEERIERRKEKALVSHQKSFSQVERVSDRKGAGVKRARRLRRSVTESNKCDQPEVSEYDSLSNEELNKRVEEFIRRFNREIRLQMQNE